MAYPRMRASSVSRQMIDTFGGYNHNLRIGEGEFFNMKNMTSDDYPVLSPRNQRGVYITAEAPGGMIAKDALCYVDGADFVINEKRVEMELLTACDGCKYGKNGDKSCKAYAQGKTACQKQLISMGAYVIILPDKKYINTKDITDFGPIEARIDTQELVTFSLCRADSTAYTAEYISGSAPEELPEELAEGVMWLDTSTSPNTLKQWSASAGMWVQIASTYVKIYSPGSGLDKKFEVYDGINISGLAGKELLTETGDKIKDPSQLAALEGAAIVWAKGEDYIVVVGILSNTWKITNSITISRTMPNMDYVIECGNRLWGCRYGVAANGEVVNELYCSKLGDFKNWNCHLGISTDSWAASVGTDGPFTGAISHLGHPLFFKENHLHKIYISSSAAHQVADTACRGVQEGCSRSLAIVGEVLYYKSRSGICAYDGSLPAEISQALGSELYTNAVAGAYGSKYYVSMADAMGAYHLFVYDAAKGLWHREDALQADSFCCCRNELYCIENGTGRILTLLGSGQSAEGPVDWMVESGLIGLSMPDMKYISRLILRLILQEGSQASVFAEYDSSGSWVQLFTATGYGTKAFTLPVRSVRCDHMRLKLEGSGPMKLFSITKTIEQGSDVR